MKNILLGPFTFIMPCARRPRSLENERCHTFFLGPFIRAGYYSSSPVFVLRTSFTRFNTVAAALYLECSGYLDINPGSGFIVVGTSWSSSSGIRCGCS